MLGSKADLKKAQEEARAASSPEQLQALINARLAQSQEGRALHVSGGYCADPGLKPPSASSLRGRELIRARTRDLAEESEGCKEQGQLPVGRLLPSRSQSSFPRSRQPQVQREQEERASSVTVRSLQVSRSAKHGEVRREEAEEEEDEDEAEEDEEYFPLTTVVRAAVRFAKPLAVSSRRAWQLLPGEKAFVHDVRRQLRLVVAGLMGSGKSTLCRMLAHMLGGVWINQDEFSHRGKSAKKAFLQEIEQEAQDMKVPVLIVDKINTMKQHRREIVKAMQGGVSGDIVFIQMVHPRDPPDRLDNLVKLCLSRIKGRGEGHRTLLASNPKLNQILKMTAGGLEPMRPDELSHFAARITVDVTKSPTQAVMQLLADLDKNNLLGRFRLDDLVTEENLNKAYSVTQKSEERLAGNDSKNTSSRERPVWYWSVDFCAEALSTLRVLADACGRDTAELEPRADLHLTLLYLGGRSDEELLAEYPHFQNVSELRQLRERLQAQEGQDVEVEIAGVQLDGRIAAATALRVGCLCANLYPHITLACRSGVPPRLSNSLLARSAANADLFSGLGHWLVQLGLSEYKRPMLDWCAQVGISTIEDLITRAAEFASYLEARDASVSKDSLVSLRQILSHAAPGKVVEKGISPFKAPLTVRGKVRGRVRGE